MKSNNELQELTAKLKNLDKNIKYSAVFSLRKQLRHNLKNDFQALDYLNRVVDCYISTL